MASLDFRALRIITTILSVFIFDASLANDNLESILIKRLIDGYDKHARPAPNVSDAVNVQFQLELQQIIDVVR